MPRARLHLAIVLVAAIVFLLGTIQSVAADPVKSTHKEVFPVSCAGQTYLVVGGRGAAAQVLESTAVLIPAAFVQVTSWVDPQTGQVVTQTDAFSVGNGNRTGQQGTQISCTYQAVFQDPEVGPITVNGTISGFLAPRT
jgi:hypothetical protein